MSTEDDERNPDVPDGEGRDLVADVLLAEHELLGASFSADATGQLQVDWYGQGEGEPEAFSQGCALADMTTLAGLVVAGERAQALVSMAVSSATPEPGQILEGLVLAGDGTIVAPVLASCLGQGRYGLWTAAECAEGLGEWLGALVGIDQGSERPFAGVTVEPMDPTQVTLMVSGPEARAILDDYLAPGCTLPAAGTIDDVTMDAIPTTMATLAAGGDLFHLIWVGAHKAPILWRSLLSFGQVVPVGTSAVWGRLALLAPGIMELIDEPTVPRRPGDVGLQGLLRPGEDFIGARALKDREED